MTPDGLRRALSLLLTFAALAWWLGVETWRGRSQEHSSRVFWLHLTAPVVAIVLMLIAIWLMLSSGRVDRPGMP